MTTTLQRELAALSAETDQLTADGLVLVRQFAAALVAIPVYRRPRQIKATLRVLPGPKPLLKPRFLSRVHGPYYILNSRMEVACTSRALRTLMECHAGDLLGTRWDQFFSRDELARRGNKFLLAAQTKRGFTHIFTCRTGSGRTVTCVERVVPYVHPVTKTFVGFFGYVRLHPVNVVQLPASHEQTA